MEFDKVATQIVFESKKIARERNVYQRLCTYEAWCCETYSVITSF